MVVQLAGQRNDLEAVVADGTAAGSPETPFGEAYDRAAGERPSQVWYLPDVGHTGAIRQAAPEYERRVTVFLDEALTGR